MNILNYNIFLRPEPEGGYTVFVPSLPGCITYGKDIAEAREMAQDAIQLYIESMREHGEPIPSDDGSIISSIRVQSAMADLESRVYA